MKEAQRRVLWILASIAVVGLFLLGAAMLDLPEKPRRERDGGVCGELGGGAPVVELAEPAGQSALFEKGFQDLLEISLRYDAGTITAGVQRGRRGYPTQSSYRASHRVDLLKGREVVYRIAFNFALIRLDPYVVYDRADEIIRAPAAVEADALEVYCANGSAPLCSLDLGAPARPAPTRSGGDETPSCGAEARAK